MSPLEDLSEARLAILDSTRAVTLDLTEQLDAVSTAVAEFRVEMGGLPGTQNLFDEVDNCAEEAMRRAHTVTIDAFKRWNDRVAGTPITLLSGDARAVFSGKAWVDGAFEVTETLLAAQRQYVDQFLINQRQLLRNLLDSNFTLTKATWDLTRGTAGSNQS